jgi:hypothetical protein
VSGRAQDGWGCGLSDSAERCAPVPTSYLAPYFKQNSTDVFLGDCLVRFQTKVLLTNDTSVISKVGGPGSEDKGGITECYPGLRLRVERVRPKAESGVGMNRVHEGKAIDRGLNSIIEVELQEVCQSS